MNVGLSQFKASTLKVRHGIKSSAINQNSSFQAQQRFSNFVGRIPQTTRILGPSLPKRNIQAKQTSSSGAGSDNEETFKLFGVDLQVKKITAKKVIPLSLMFFAILFNYTILRDTKDVLVVTAPGSGAEIIPFLKTYVNLPAAIGFTVLYTKLSNVMTPYSLFFFILFPFLAFFGSFAYLIYPNTGLLHPTDFCDKMLDKLGPQFMGPLAVLRNWSYSMFYVMAELWGSVVVSVLFWGFAVSITTIEESKRWFPFFGMFGNVALICSGQAVRWLSDVRTHLPEGVDGWGYSLRLMMGLVVVFGAVIAGCYYWMNKNVVPYIEAGRKKPKKNKEKMSVVDSFKFLAQQRYIRNMAFLVIGYGISINLVEVTWKSKLKQQFSDPNAYSMFMGNFSTATGTVTLLLMLASQFIFRKFGWGFAALITPITLFITGVMFFSLVLGGTSLGPALESIHPLLTPLMAACLVGAAQNVFSKGAKYSLFDPCKEMAYIPLEEETRIKGKGAIDVICNPLGKSGGALIQQFMIFSFGSLAASTPYLAATLFVIVGLWIWAARDLNVLFTAYERERSIQTMKSEITSSMDGTQKTKQQSMPSVDGAFIDAGTPPGRPGGRSGGRGE